MTAPWGFERTPGGQIVPRRSPGDFEMAGGFPQYPQLGLLAPAQQGFNPLTVKKPSIVDRVLGRLFPTAQYTGLLDPDAQRGVQRQGLLNLGSSLLQAGGPQAYQGGTLANLGGALQQSQVNFPQMAEQALQLQAYKSQLAQRQVVAGAVAQHPAPAGGETREQAYNRLTQIITAVAGTPGGIETAAQLAPVLNALKPPTAGERGDWQIVPGEGPDGKLKLYRVNRLTGETKDTGLLKPTPVKEPTPAERVASSQYESAAGSVAKMKDIAGRNPAAAKEAVAAIKAARYGKLGTLYSELRGQLSSQDAQDFYTNYNNAILAVTPTYGGARPTQQLLDLEKAATLPAIGSGDFQSAFTHMEGRLKDLKAKAGKAFQAPEGPPAPKYRKSNPFAP